MPKSKSIVPFVARSVEVGSKAIGDSRNPEFYRSTGSLVGVKELAKRRNVDIDGKKGTPGHAMRKALMRELDNESHQLDVLGRLTMGAALSDPTMRSKKVQFVHNKAGEFTGINLAVRRSYTVGGVQELQKQLADAKNQLEQLKLKLSTPEAEVVK